MKKPEGFMLFFDRLEPMRNLPNEQTGIIFKAIWDYAETGVIPELTDHLLPYWTVLRLSVDRNVTSYNETSIKNRYNRYKGEIKKSNQEPADIWEWWAAQQDYTPALFKKEVWYDDAATSYQQRATTVDDGQQALRNVTNQTQTKHEPNTSPNTNTSPNAITSPNTNKRGVGGVQRRKEKNDDSKSEDSKSIHAAAENVSDDDLSIAWEEYGDMRDSIGRPYLDFEDIDKTMEQLQSFGNYDPKVMVAILRQAINDKQVVLRPLE